MNKRKNFFEAENGAVIYALGIAALIVLQFFVGLAIIGLGEKIDDKTYNMLQIVGSIVLEAGFIAVFFAYTRIKSVEPSCKISRNISPASIAAGVLAAPLCLLMFYGAAVLFDKWLVYAGYTSESAFSEAKGVIQIILAVVATVIAAPIGEELILRGGLLSGLKKNFSDTAAAVLCGLAFSLMHMNPAQTVYQFFLGFAAAYLVIASDSLIPAFLLHAASNLIAILSGLIGPIGKTFDAYEKLFSGNLAAAVITALVMAAAGTAIIISGCKFLKKFERERRKRKGIPSADETVTVLPYGGARKGGRTYYILLAIPFAVTVFMWIFNFAATVSAG